VPEKQTVKCPECGTDTVIYNGDGGCCVKCGLDVEAVYRRARHEAALKKVMNTTSEPEPKPKPNKKSNDPFSPDFGL
jgi:ssDNA-binding Zn-finger/Zn-ribbon topoisomerase 1